MGEVNNKSVEKAIAIMSRPWIYKADETPMLSAGEIMGRVREIYMLGFDDGRRQLEADGIISKVKNDGGD